MPRIQILHLPAAADEHPFAVVIDEWRDPPATNLDLSKFKDDIGATALLVFEDTVDIP